MILVVNSPFLLPIKSDFGWPLCTFRKKKRTEKKRKKTFRCYSMENNLSDNPDSTLKSQGIENEELQLGWSKLEIKRILWFTCVRRRKEERWEKYHLFAYLASGLHWDWETAKKSSNKIISLGTFPIGIVCLSSLFTVDNVMEKVLESFTISGQLLHLCS